MAGWAGYRVGAGAVREGAYALKWRCNATVRDICRKLGNHSSVFCLPKLATCVVPLFPPRLPVTRASRFTHAVTFKEWTNSSPSAQLESGRGAAWMRISRGYGGYKNIRGGCEYLYILARACLASRARRGAGPGRKHFYIPHLQRSRDHMETRGITRSTSRLCSRHQTREMVGSARVAGRALSQPRHAGGLLLRRLSCGGGVQTAREPPFEIAAERALRIALRLEERAQVLRREGARTGAAARRRAHQPLR